MAAVAVLPGRETPAYEAAREGADLRETANGRADRLRLRTSGARAWGELRIDERLLVLRRARVLMAERAERFAEAIAGELERSLADTLVAEVLPLLGAIRYLERDAAKVLQSRRVGVRGRPLWLGRVTSEVERVPLGRVLVIGVSNYPLLLPGVQVAQALAAGNAVIWKPGHGGARVARLFAETLREAGLPERVLAVTDESVAAAQAAIGFAEDPLSGGGIGKLFFKGSAAA